MELLSFVLAILVFALLFLVLTLKNQNDKLSQSVEQQEKSNQKILSQKKSSEVRLGLISEKLAPFLDGFDLDPQGLYFLGQPIDYVHFGEDKITIVEVKSGNARLSAKQKKIKKLVENKKIEWFTYKIK